MWHCPSHLVIIMCASCTCRIIYASKARCGFISKWYYTCWIMGCKCCLWLPCWTAGLWPQLEWPKATRIKKKKQNTGVYWVKGLNVGLWTLVSCPRLSHKQLCVLIVPLALLGSDWSISLLHVNFLLPLSGSWTYQLPSLTVSSSGSLRSLSGPSCHHHHHCLSKGGVMLWYPLRTHAFHWQISSASKDCLWELVHIFNLLY